MPGAAGMASGGGDTATRRIHKPKSPTLPHSGGRSRGSSYVRPQSSQTLKCRSARADDGRNMSSLRLRRTLGVKLGLAFAAVLAIMLGSLGMVLLKSSHAANAYERAINWKVAVDGAAKQAAGTRQQQAAQALYVATGDKRYKAEGEQGVEISETAGKSFEALHDPQVTKIPQTATAADEKHDATVNSKRFPAMEA